MLRLYYKHQKLFLFLFIILLSSLFLQPLSLEGDLYHHLNTGKFVLDNFQLPHKDQWTFTAYGKEWIAYAWMSDIILYSVYSLIGPGAVVILVAAIAGLTIYFSYLLFINYGLEKKTAFLLTTLTACLFATRFPSRPEIFSYPLILGILLVDKLSLKNLKMTFFFPAIIFFWSIFYGSSVIAGLILIFILSAFRRKRLYFLSVIFSIFILFFNGYGAKSILYFLNVSQLIKIQGEWLGIKDTLNLAPASYLNFFYFSLTVYIFYLLFYLFVLSSSIKSIWSEKKEFLLSLGIFVPIFAFRQLPISVILSIPFISTVLAKLNNKKLNLLLFILSVASLLITLIYSPPQMNLNEDPSKIAVLNFIEKNKLFGKIYTSQQIGSFLSFKLYPKALVSYDTRDDLFFGTQYLRDILSPLPFILILNKYRPNLVVLDLNEDKQKAENLSKTSNLWKLCYSRENYLIFCPANTAF